MPRVSTHKETGRGGGLRDNSLLISQSVVVVAVIALIIHTIRTLFECHNASVLITIICALLLCEQRRSHFLLTKETLKAMKRSSKSCASGKSVLNGLNSTESSLQGNDSCLLSDGLLIVVAQRTTMSLIHL